MGGGNKENLGDRKQHIKAMHKTDQRQSYEGRKEEITYDDEKRMTCNAEDAMKYMQDGPGTEPEPETGTLGAVFPGTERGTGTARTVFQEPKPLSLSIKTLLQYPETLSPEAPSKPKNWNRSSRSTKHNRTEPWPPCVCNGHSMMKDDS